MKNQGKPKVPKVKEMGKNEFKTFIKSQIKVNFDDQYKLDSNGVHYVNKDKGDQHA